MDSTVGRRGMPFQLRVQYETEAKSKNKKGMSLAVIRFDDGKGSLGIINEAWRFKVYPEDAWFINEPVTTR